MGKNCSLIAVIDNNFGIGSGGDQLAYISGDLKRFKQLTSGKPVVMGRKTFEALPKGALPNRRNIILSRNENLIYPNSEIVGSVEDTFFLLNDVREFFVIGGGEIYKLFLPFANRIYLTHIHHSFENVDTYFPKFDIENWELITQKEVFEDPKTGLSYSFKEYIGKSIILR
ncbi:MAG: dihydrofolate reductase [Marinilabiliaceae bacterium]|nr:dihydrofolate reductase [Marinilabiliaceae bacterium]